MNQSEEKYLNDNGLIEPPKCYCGNPLKFRSYSRGYAKYCCAACANKDPRKKEATRKNMLAKYGVENISQIKAVKDKKAGKCNKGRGKPWTEAQHKLFKATMQQRYGVDHPSQLPEYIQKRENTWLTKYGVKHISELESTKQSKRNKKDMETISNHSDIVDIVHRDGITFYICNCPIHGKFEIPSGIYYDRKRLDSELCTMCQPIGYISKSKLESFIENLLIAEGVVFQKHVRGILDKKELDFYIPSHNLAIECNGVYWHSDKVKTDKKYHFQKYSKCNLARIQLIQIWEDWIQNKPDIVRDVVRSKLGIYNERVFARKCAVKEITQIEADNILQYHIQGTIKSSYRFGLFYDGRLIACMLFNKFRGNMMGKINSGYELSRFCTIPGMQVIGGASRLLKYFIRRYNPDKITSFSANDISNGNLYKALGFINKKQSSGSYWYIQHNTLIRFHRFHFRKSELKKMGYEYGTEFEIMNKRPYHRIYDSGTTCWELMIKKEDLD